MYFTVVGVKKIVISKISLYRGSFYRGSLVILSSVQICT